MKKHFLGIFDSGVGGLTVYKEIKRLVPGVPVIYIGDTARVPYGTKSPQTVTRYSDEITNYLCHKGIKMLVVACNTASATALKTLKRKYRFPVIDVIQPGAAAAVKATSNKRIGVIGTSSTIRSGAYEKEIKHIDPSCRVFSNPSPLLVPMAEEGWQKKSVLHEVIDYYLNPIMKKRIDTLVLGCTHYPLLKRYIKHVTGSNIRLVDSAVETAGRVKNLIEKKIEKEELSKNPTDIFRVTDDPANFKIISRRFLGRQVSAKKIII